MALWEKLKYPDQPVADGPVGPSFTLGPVGPRRMFSQGKSDQPVAVGPVGQSFTPGPVGPCGIGSKCKPDDPIAIGPVGSTEIPDPGDETERPIQIDLMKIVPTDGPASLVDTPPSSAISRILQGRDSRSVRFLVPDTRGLDQSFHDVTIVDMDDEREPMVTPADMTRLRELWPQKIFNHMK